jgi:phage-related protein
MLFACPVLIIFGTFIKVLSPFVSIISKVAMWIFRLARYLMVMLDFAAEGDTIFIGFGAAATAVSIPVLAIVAAVVALVAGLGILYVKNRAFHHAVVTAWNAIKHAVEAAIRFIEKDWRGLLVVLLGPFGVVIDLIVAYWSQIESAAGAVVTFITGHWRTFVNALLTIFAPIAKAIIDHFGNIKTFGSAAWGVIKTAVGWVVSEIQSLISWLGKIHWPSAPGWLTNNFITKHLAAGTTNWGGGVAMVGERGPELVNLPRGSQVYTAQQTSAMMAGGVAGVMGGGGVSTLSGVLKIINWEEGLVMIDTVAQTAIDHNNAYRRR